MEKFSAIDVGDLQPFFGELLSTYMTPLRIIDELEVILYSYGENICNNIFLDAFAIWFHLYNKLRSY